MNRDFITRPFFQAKTTWRRMAALMAAAGMLALVDGLLNPRAPAWSESEVALGKGELALDAALLKANNILWIDARRVVEYSQAHIPGALPLNEDGWNELLPAVLAAWQPGRRVIVYCGSRQCQASREVAERLRDEVGLANVFVLKGGWESWQTHAQ